jgi:hypothetical protein
MPDVLVAGPVLEEDAMSDVHMLGERLVDAREAALCLNLPTYWLTYAKERLRLGLPHYRVGKLVRFKLDELADWINAQQTQVTVAVTREDADAGLQ